MTIQSNSNLQFMAYEIAAAKEAIQQSLKRFTDAWNVHDAKALSMIFTKDADFTNIFGQHFFGRNNIEAQHAPIFQTIFKSSNLIFTETRIRLINEITAAVDVFWNMHGATDMNGNAWQNRKGLINLVMVNEEGRWQILVLHNMELPAIASSVKNN